MIWKTCSSPVGELFLTAEGGSLTGVYMKSSRFLPAFPDGCRVANAGIFHQAEEWLHAYFHRQPLPLLPPLKPAGTPFQQEVWSLLLEIPYGQTVTYGALASRLRSMGVRASAQAVGGAVGRNPISILIPCHRVLGADGSLTGYAAGTAIKQALLQLEQQPS